jgi:hypothetical protein
MAAKLKLFSLEEVEKVSNLSLHGPLADQTCSIIKRVTWFVGFAQLTHS